MQSYKVVTVCPSDTHYPSRWKDSFIPVRRSLSKSERRLIFEGKPRIQSAPLSSILRPMLYTDLTNNIPVLLKSNPRVMRHRKSSIDSDVLQREITSAVLLLESRNERDMQPQNINKDFHYKVHDRNKMSAESQQVIEQRINNDQQRWRSAKNSNQRPSVATAKIPHLRMLSSDGIRQVCRNSSKMKNDDKQLQHDVQRKNSEPSLIISSSNSLTNFITIDDIAGIKNSWMQGKETYSPPEKVPDIKTTTTSSIDLDQIEYLRSREDVLRQYMDVYMHWRTLNAIEEHRNIIRGRSSSAKSAKIRSATPKERLELFKNVINERHSSMQRKTKFATTIVNGETSPIEKISKPNNHLLLASIMKNEKNMDKESNEYATFDNIEASETFTGTEIKEEEEDVSSVTYSEIDWLECEDTE